MTRTPRAITAVCALIAITAFAAAPADAKTRSAHRTALSKLEKKQNAGIRKTGQRVTALGKRTAAAETSLKSAGATLAQALVDIQTNKDGLAGITAAVPTVISSLQKLGDGALQLKAGLEQVGAGLTTLAAGTTAGFDAVKATLGAQEYGVVQAYLGGTAVPGALLVSSDIPDDTNASTVTGKMTIPVPDGTAATDLVLKAAVRSGESDGTGPTNPVAVANLMAMTAEPIGIAGMSVTGGNPSAPTTLPLTSAPNVNFGGLPVYGIADKAPRIDATPNPLAFPAAQSIELTDPATLATLTAAPGRFVVANSSGAPGVAIVNVTVRFFDLSASATDGTA